MSQTVVELIDVAKVFRGNFSWRTFRAVDGLSVALQKGEIFGLIGHNGAGKTTTFKMLVGFLRPTRGTLVWCGERLAWDQRRDGIGFSPEHPYFYDYLTVGETLRFYGHLYGMPAAERRRRVQELAATFGIGSKLNTPMRALSKGTLQRVAVAQAIMHRPRLAILDEPMSGLDPAGRKHMRELIASLKNDGTTVLFSSHILSDAEALCDRVGILAGGRLRELVNVSEETNEPISYKVVARDMSPATLERLRRLTGDAPTGGPRRWVVQLKDLAMVQCALGQLHGTEAQVEAVLPQYPSLEQRFLRYVGNGSEGD